MCIITQEGIDAVSDVIQHIETYDVTSIRASTPMFLMSRKIKSLGVKMVLSGEGSDEVFGGYLYFHKAPNKVGRGSGGADEMRVCWYLVGVRSGGGAAMAALQCRCCLLLLAVDCYLLTTVDCLLPLPPPPSSLITYTTPALNRRSSLRRLCARSRRCTCMTACEQTSRPWHGEVDDDGDEGLAARLSDCVLCVEGGRV